MLHCVYSKVTVSFSPGGPPSLRILETDSTSSDHCRANTPLLRNVEILFSEGTVRALKVEKLKLASEVKRYRREIESDL